MAIKNDYNIQVQNGRYIILPPWKEGQSGWGNRAVPNPFAAGGDVSQIYPVHTRFVDFEREFIYGYVESVSSGAKANLGLFNTNKQETITWGATANVIGDTLIGILASTLDDETTAVANIFAGGYLMPRSNPYGAYRIVSNTAYNDGRTSGEMDIVIEESGLGAATPASTASGKLSRNPYTAMRCEWIAGNGWRSVVGATLILPTASRYQWVQVVGPIMLMGDEAAGKSTYLRTVWWHIDGSVVATSQGTHTNTHQPVVAGYLLDMTASDYTWFVWMNRLG